MSTILSTWATSPVAVNGSLTAAEWAGAAIFPLAGGGVNYGRMLVKNDHEHLYVALDITRDLINTPGTGDYFWFMLDADGNQAVTPNVDCMFSTTASTGPNEMRRWYFIAPNTWKPINPITETIQSIVRQGFAPSSASASPHRIWEFRFKLTELGVTFVPSGVPMVVRFGLRVGSTTPAFTFETPGALGADIASYHSIVLSPSATGTYPAGTAGPVIGGVGLIPATRIDAVTGHATTDPSYYVPVRDAAFGATMNLIGNRVTMAALWAAGARKYQVLKAYEGGAYTPLLQNWSNYRWNGSDYILDFFGPNASQQYDLLNPGVDYSIDDLLIQWNSTDAPNGRHRFKVRFYLANGTTVVPSVDQTLTLNVDNNAPYLEINRILHNGVEVGPCAIETMTSATDGLQFEITVQDAEGNLEAYSLAAGYGNGLSAGIHSDNYAAHISPSKQWTGVNRLLVPASPAEWVPPVTCAYGFHLSASRKVTNGYGMLGPVMVSRYITLIKSGGLRMALRQSEAVMPLGV